MWWILTGCTTHLNVVTSSPEAEIGVLRSPSQPPVDNPAAEVRGVGELHTRVSYSILDTWWLWTRLPGGEVNVQRYPTQVAVGPAVGCAFLVVPCLWVSKPVSSQLTVEAIPPEPVQVPVVALPVVPAPAGCTKDTDCKGERICSAGVCADP